jgi:hypothetical protein
MNIRLHHSSATAASIPSSPQSPELSQAVYAMDRARLVSEFYFLYDRLPELF